MANFLYPWFPEDLESEFSRQYNQDSARVARTALMLGGAIYVGFYIWDLVIDASRSTETLVIRLVVALMVAAILLVPRDIFARHLQKMLSLAILVAGLAHVAILSILHSGFGGGFAGGTFVFFF